jgi:transposase
LTSARNALPTEPSNGHTCGIDWASDDHAVSIVDAHGREMVRRTIEHTAAGLRELLAVLERDGAREVAIERADGPVVSTLLDAGVTVVVISPNQVKNLRGRYGSAGNKDDRFDAFVLADTLRTDRARLHPLLPDSPATVTLRQTCRARARTSSPTGLPWPTSCAPTSTPCSPVRSACSPTSTVRSAWPF